MQRPIECTGRKFARRSRRCSGKSGRKNAKIRLPKVILALGPTMISILLSRMAILLSGIMYPAYRSYKAVRLKDAKEYMKWMMYWIVFALFCVIESFADIFVSFWFPFYYELKIAFVFWLVSPWTKGATIMYRKWIHPTLMKHEEEIDRLLEKAKAETYNQAVNAGRRSLLYAREVVATAAVRSQAHIAEQALALSGTLMSTENLASVGSQRDENKRSRRSAHSRHSSESTSFDVDSRMDPMLESTHSATATHRRKAPSAPTHSDSEDDMEVLEDTRSRRSSHSQSDYNTIPRRSSRTRRQPT